MGSAALLIPMLLELTPVAACPGAMSATFDVVASHGPVATLTDFTLPHLRSLADSTGMAGKHEPLGFYYATFGYSIQAEIGGSTETRCSGPVHVTVTLMLFDRRVEIGSELKDQPCLFSLAHEHYAKHAAYDDSVLTQFAQALRPALTLMDLPLLQGEPSLAEADSGRVEQAVKSVVDRGSESLDRARSATSERVDTADELQRLNNGCRPGN